jgi:hypothetical protein
VILSQYRIRLHCVVVNLLLIYYTQYMYVALDHQKPFMSWQQFNLYSRNFYKSANLVVHGKQPLRYMFRRTSLYISTKIFMNNQALVQLTNNYSSRHAN